ncbi:3-deoxy-D-manno-octulosonate 8-phosphate phosphatase (KDO 8-P phosphatase) [Mucilaginibacter gracilis]|uniref:3-deoxy-D-manno-octulosonate 8-phosphate phosphatase (KDO 8-P phosphatase) n=1 Tax=Mucilaginibacter gracilis TaxID=423350 RepID=A0A495J3Y4_9SPHI|nr:HAD hydrolase family protein [Mucilaginibacter gracilis]RKR82709.1 3-deoxy-D-manno-octulosonate 8-phosphate phosphatase (KDO 8-P phosphatase) [Mucilaginibacter gracilis]
MLNKLKDITTFIFDVDGVLTDGSVFVTEAGEQCRTFNTKDGYAIQLAVKCMYNVCVITGGKSEGVRHRLNGLGVTDVFLGAHTKLDIYKDYISKNYIDPANILYMGDDIPDIDIMKVIGLPTCPADAAEEVKAVSRYISPVLGGRGCVRDVIEKVLKIQGKWMSENATSL